MIGAWNLNLLGHFMNLCNLENCVALHWIKIWNFQGSVAKPWG